MFKKQKESTKLETALDNALTDLIASTSQEDYERHLAHVEKLHKIQETPDRVSYDNMAMIAANLLGIILVIKHENVNVITSKAMNMIPKPKNPQF